MPAAIAAGHPSTAEAGALTLAAGGNAVDACIVAAFVALVTQGPLAGPTGGGFCLVHEPDKPATALDCFFSLPRGALGVLEGVVIGFSDAGAPAGPPSSSFCRSMRTTSRRTTSSTACRSRRRYPGDRS